jgi:hypothetical protein
LQLWNKYISCFNTTVLGTNSAVNYLGTAQNVIVTMAICFKRFRKQNICRVTTIAGDLVISDTAVALLFNNTGSSTGTLTLGNLQTTLGSYGGTSSTATVTNGTWFGSTTTGTINVFIM